MKPRHYGYIAKHNSINVFTHFVSVEWRQIRRFPNCPLVGESEVGHCGLLTIQYNIVTCKLVPCNQKHPYSCLTGPPVITPQAGLFPEDMGDHTTTTQSPKTKRMNII